MQPKTIRLDELFRREINPDRHVVCIGPDESVERDPSGFFAATLLNGRKGRLYFVDRQSRRLVGQIRGYYKNSRIARQKSKLLNLLLEGAHYAAGAVGDPKAHAEQIEGLIENGIPAKAPIVKIAYAHATGFPDKSIGMIIDAGSLPWIVFGNAVERHIKHGEALQQAAPTEPEKYGAILREYRRVSSKTIFLAEPTNPERVGGGGNSGFFPSCEVLKKALRLAGAKNVKEIAVQNEYQVDCPPGKGVGPFLHHGYGYTKALVAEW